MIITKLSMTMKSKNSGSKKSPQAPKTSNKHSAARRVTTRAALRDLGKDLPSAYASVVTASMNIKQTPDGVELEGRDLVQPLPTSVAINSQQYLFAVIPANPCYWRGTRISALAAAHQCFRPRKLRFGYVPQVAVTTTGTVLCGTTWNTPLATESLEQSMVTSNGGAMSPCYVPFTTEVRLGSNLQQNLFTCAGSLDEDHNPFLFIALMRGANIVPGYFYVEYCYSLKNPLGQAVAYDSLLTTAPEFGAVRIDRSIVTLGTVPGLAGPGMVLDLEADGSCYYNDTLVELPDGAPVMVYANNPITVVDPTFTTQVQSVIVLPNSAEVGSSVNLQADRATWNWETDGNFATGAFRAGGATPVSFYSTLRSLSVWVDNVATTLGLYIYALDLATNTIGAFITFVRAVSGTQANPSTILSISPRLDTVARRRVDRLRAPAPRGGSGVKKLGALPDSDPELFFS